LAPGNLPMVRAGAPFMTSDAPARSPLNVEISAKIPTAILDAAIGTLGRDKVLMVRVEHQFPGRLLVLHSLALNVWISAKIPP